MPVLMIGGKTDSLGRAFTNENSPFPLEWRDSPVGNDILQRIVLPGYREAPTGAPLVFPYNSYAYRLIKRRLTSSTRSK